MDKETVQGLILLAGIILCFAVPMMVLWHRRKLTTVFFAVWMGVVTMIGTLIYASMAHTPLWYAIPVGILAGIWGLLYLSFYKRVRPYAYSVLLRRSDNVGFGAQAPDVRKGRLHQVCESTGSGGDMLQRADEWFAQEPPEEAQGKLDARSLRASHPESDTAVSP
ncbi:MAG: hypothetical protein HGA39_05350 [Coriobacteriia bacterium]|nr:hypothetical protein [Coriobacteriia bacterium]